MNSDFNSASSTPAYSMFKGGRPAKTVWEHFVKVESNGKKLLDASSVVTRCHPNVIECWFITPSAKNHKFIKHVLDSDCF